MNDRVSLYNIILSPVITEKATNDKLEKNKYALYVDLNANKSEIKNAVEEIFGVTVISVNTLMVKGKPKRLGKYFGKTSRKKKAVVTLKEGDRIKLMEGP